jgi:hypothetical protein
MNLAEPSRCHVSIVEGTSDSNTWKNGNQEKSSLPYLQESLSADLQPEKPFSSPE